MVDGAHAGKKGDTGTGEGAVEEAVGEHAAGGVVGGELCGEIRS